MDSLSSGRSLTSFGGVSSYAGVLAPTDTAIPVDDDALFTPTALDFAHQAFLARTAIKVSISPIFINAQAVDSASFVGRGATFSVYRRRIPRQKTARSKVQMDGYSVEMEDYRKLPDVIAYKVAMIDFSEKGEASTHASRQAINGAVMELYLSAHRPVLQHPNVVDFLGLAWGANPFDPSRKLPVLIVEFAEHGSISDLQKRECLGLETRRKLCLDVCQGLHMLHSCGIVHGDIKAENVLVFSDEKHRYIAKLSDFGYSTVMSTREDALCLGGTRPWKAPEAKTAVKMAEAKYTDVYSLALLIWCTYAHGQNIFRTLIDPSKQGDEYYAEAERLKEHGQLATRTQLANWYPRALMSATHGDPLQLLANLSSIQQRLQQLHTQPDNATGIVERVEELLCAVPPAAFPTSEAVMQQILATVQRLGLYRPMQHAVSLGLSNDPTERKLEEIMVSLGHDGSCPEKSTESDMVLQSNLKHHQFTWHNWPLMDPSVQKYLTDIYIRRSETDAEKNMINPPEAFLLASLYINGYGVDQDMRRAARWLSAARNAKHPLAMAYGYRIARATGIPPNDLADMEKPMQLMALRGSRIALQDLASVCKTHYDETKKLVRDALAGVGTGFFSYKAMLHEFSYDNWMNTFDNIPVLLDNFSVLHRIADYKVNTRGDRILHIASSCGKTEAIEALLGRFVALEVNQLNDQGETPLLCACRAGQTSTVLWLASHGATASGGARNGESPLHWLISFDDDNVETVGAALIQAGAEVDAKTTGVVSHHANFPTSLVSDRLPEGYPIGWATHCDRPRIVKFLLSNMDNPLLCAMSWPRANSALEAAVAQFRSECLKLIVENIEAFNVQEGAPSFRGVFVTHLLYQAIIRSSLFDMMLYNGAAYQRTMKETLDLLISRANTVTAVHFDGGSKRTLLYLAVSMARDEVVEYLLKHGDEAMRTGEHYDEQILSSQDSGAFKKTDLNRACGVELRTPLLEAVRWNRPKLVSLLLEHGAHAHGGSKNPFSGQHSTWTVLHALAQSGHDDPRLIPLLVEHGAPVDGFPEHADSTESPLLVAVQCDSFKVADALVSLGADPNLATTASGHLTLTHPTSILGHVVASNARNSITRLRYLLGESRLAAIGFVVEPERRWTALHRAAAAHIEASFRGTDAAEAAPLQWADVDWPANREILNELLARFSTPDQINAAETSAGLTPLHLAVVAGNDAAVSLLLSREACLDVPSEAGRGQTATAMALEMRCLEGVQVSRQEAAARERCHRLLNPST